MPVADQVLLDKVVALKALLVMRATEGSGDDDEYQALRRELLADPRVKAKAPDFLRSCRTLAEFWGYIKASGPTWADRRERLRIDFDPLLTALEQGFGTPVFTGSRKDGYERNMAVDYVHHAVEVQQMSSEEFSAKFNLHLSRAIRPFPKRSEAAECFVDMHKRHSETVSAVVKEQLRQHTNELFEGKLENTCMLALVAGQQHLGASWRRYADRIVQLLTAGLPIACKTHKPKNEPHLQEICDGILQADDSVLVREYPLMGWSSSRTKPDWSAEPLRLWVELKYVRESKDIRQITEDIAADITKYGDNNRRVLFVVYDPNHLIINDDVFSAPIVARPTMVVNFIRRLSFGPRCIDR